MDNKEYIAVLHEELHMILGLIPDGYVPYSDEKRTEAINAAIVALENQGCGCDICLAHNNWVCPKLQKEGKVDG
jgi:hypothetical protein